MKNPREARALGIQKDNRALAKLQDKKSSMDETDYLLASPNNAAHLRKALKDFQNGQRNFASLDKITYLARLIHEFAKNFYNFISYNQLCNLGQKSLFRCNNWQVQYLRQFLRFYEFFGLGRFLLPPQR